MKILLITDNHSLIGGAERSFFDLKSRLQQKADLQVYSLGYGQKEENGNDYVILKAPRSNLAKLWWRLCFHPFLFIKLRKHLKRIQPDVIHLHTCKYYTPTLFFTIKDYPVIHTTHDFSAICPTAQNIHRDLSPCTKGFNWRCFFKHHVKHHLFTYLILVHLFHRTKKYLKRTIDAFTAPSPFLAGYLEKNNFQPVSYIPPFHPATQQLPINQIKPLHFLFAGTLGHHKGVHILLDEFAIACKVNPGLKLFIAGEGPLKNTLQQQAERLQIVNNVIFTGWQSSLKNLIAQSIAVIFPSIGLEAFGLSMTEAMQSGRAVIGANRGTISWLVKDNETGLLFDPCKSGNLAKKILALANNRELAEQLGKQALQDMEQRFDNDYTLQKLLTLYQKYALKA